MSDRERKEEEEEGPSLPSDSRRKKEEVLCGGRERNEEKTEAEGKPKSAVFSSSPQKKPSDKAHGFLDGAFLLREFPRLPMPREGGIF